MNVIELLQKLEKPGATKSSGASSATPKPSQSVYVLVGEEALLRDRALAALRNHHTDEATLAFNHDVFHAKDTQPQRIVEAVKTLPMLAGQRFIVVKEAELFSAEDLEHLSPLIEHPVPTTCLILMAQKLDGRSRFARLVKQKEYWIDVQPPRAKGLSTFIMSEAKRRGHALGANESLILMEILGVDLLAIDDALERLSLYVGPHEPITAEAIEAVVVYLPLATIWDLVDGVSALDQHRALTALCALERLREPPLRIVAMLARQFRILARMKDALSNHTDPLTAARHAGAPPFKAAELAAASRKLANARLRLAFKELAGLDQALKSSRCPPEVLLQQAVLRLSAPAT